jgi:hypothetical protein
MSAVGLKKIWRLFAEKNNFKGSSCFCMKTITYAKYPFKNPLQMCCCML